MRQQNFLETSLPEGVVPVWAALEKEQRAEVVEVLARLIAKIVAIRGAQSSDAGVEADDE